MVVNKLSRSVGRDEVSQLHSVQTWKIWCYQLRAALLQILSPPGIRWNHQASVTDPEIVLCHRASVAAQLPLREHSVAYYSWNTNPRPLILLPFLWMSTVTISKAVMKIFQALAFEEWGSCSVSQASLCPWRGVRALWPQGHQLARRDSCPPTAWERVSDVLGVTGTMKHYGSILC